MTHPIEVTTDTAWIAIFDPGTLEHRQKHPANWWTKSKVVIREINDGNLALIKVGSDGSYTFDIVDNIPDEGRSVTFKLRCPSGRLFFGGGEWITGGGKQPDAGEGGDFLTVKPGGYELTIAEKGAYELAVAVRPTRGKTINAFKEAPSLFR